MADNKPEQWISEHEKQSSSFPEPTEQSSEITANAILQQILQTQQGIHGSINIVIQRINSLELQIQRSQILQVARQTIEGCTATYSPIEPYYGPPISPVLEHVSDNQQHKIQESIDELVDRISALESQMPTPQASDSAPQIFDGCQPIDTPTSDASLPTPTPIDTALQSCGLTAALCVANHGRDIVDDLGSFGGEERGTSVYTFVSKVEVTAEWHNPSAVAYCLRRALTGEANAWYYGYKEFNETLPLHEDLPAFKAALIKQFGISRIEAMDLLWGEHYTYTDARERRHPSEYVHKIMRLGKLAGLSRDAALEMAWYQIAPGLCRHILQPYKGMPVDELIDIMNRSWFRSHPVYIPCDCTTHIEGSTYDPAKNYPTRKSDPPSYPPPAYGLRRNMARGSVRARPLVHVDHTGNGVFNDQRRPPGPPQNYLQAQSDPRSHRQPPNVSDNSSNRNHVNPRRHWAYCESVEDEDLNHIQMGPDTSYDYNPYDVERHGIPPFGCRQCQWTYGSWEGITAHAKECHGQDLWEAEAA